MTSLSDEELLRYSRHLLLPELGLEAQMLWKNSQVSVIGCGGLGHPAALYLASSGVGHIHLVDDDVVESSNLQRQIGFTTADLSKPKACVLADVLTALNPYIKITTSLEPVSDSLSNESMQVLTQSQIIFDCTDNFKARYCINRLSLQCAVPLISAAAIGFEGIVGVFNQQQKTSPCYACLFHERDALEVQHTCSDTGVFAPLLGVVGAYQAGLGLKLLARQYAGGAAGIMVWDLRTLKSRYSELEKDLACSVCS